MLESTVTPRRQDDQVRFDLPGQLADLFEGAAGQNVAIVRPKLNVVPPLDFTQSILHECNRVGTVQHQMTRLRNGGEFVG